MSLQNKLIALALGLAALAPTAAGADPRFRDWDRDHDRGERGWRGHRHDDRCHHEATPAVDLESQGRYELRTVQRWVEASYQQVWVPKSCVVRPFRGRVVCTGGFYEQQLQPAHYENAQEYVWVPAYRPVNGTWTSSASAGPVTFQVSGAF